MAGRITSLSLGKQLGNILFEHSSLGTKTPFLKEGEDGSGRRLRLLTMVRLLSLGSLGIKGKAVLGFVLDGAV